MDMWIMHVWIKVCLNDYDNQSNGVEGFQMRQKFLDFSEIQLKVLSIQKDFHFLSSHQYNSLTKI